MQPTAVTQPSQVYEQLLPNLAANPSSQQASADYTDFIKKMRDPLSIYNEATQSLGIPDARNRVTDLRKQLVDTENLIRGVDPSVRARTSGVFATEGKQQALISKERAPLYDQYRTDTSAIDIEQDALAMLLGEANTQTNFGVQGEQIAGDRLNSRVGQAQTAEQQAEQERMNAVQEELNRASARLKEQMFAFEKSSADRDYKLQQSKLSSDNYYRSQSLKASQQQAETKYKESFGSKAKKDGGGFDFTDPNGNSISAYNYAKGTGASLQAVLKRMGDSGDSYAKSVYGQLKADPWFDFSNPEGSRNFAQYKRMYSPLFWG